MLMLDVLILEDEEYTLRYLQTIVSEHPMVKGVFGTSNGRDAVRLAREQKPNVAFLDIELSPEDDHTGLEIAGMIAEISPASKIVFVTAYTQYALDSFSVHPYDYILKPITKTKVFDTLYGVAREYKQQSQSRPKRIVVQSGRQELVFLVPSEIFFFERQGKTTLVHTRNGVYELARSLSNLTESLPKEFLRTHKSYIVNINRIRKVRNIGNRSWEIIFQGYDKPALMSRYKYEEYKELFASSI
jgi:two-component system LytT family response regulator